MCRLPGPQRVWSGSSRGVTVGTPRGQPPARPPTPHGETRPPAGAWAGGGGEAQEHAPASPPAPPSAVAAGGRSSPALHPLPGGRVDTRRDASPVPRRTPHATCVTHRHASPSWLGGARCPLVAAVPAGAGRGGAGRGGGGCSAGPPVFRPNRGGADGGPDADARRIVWYRRRAYVLLPAQPDCASLVLAGGGLAVTGGTVAAPATRLSADDPVLGTLPQRRSEA